MFSSEIDAPKGMMVSIGMATRNSWLWCTVLCHMQLGGQQHTQSHSIGP